MWKASPELLVMGHFGPRSSNPRKIHPYVFVQVVQQSAAAYYLNHEVIPDDTATRVPGYTLLVQQAENARGGAHGVAIQDRADATIVALGFAV
jgi:hypothetical protein